LARGFHSTPLRLTAALIALFSVVVFLSFGVAYVVARKSVETTIRASLYQELAVYRAAPSADALSALVEAQASAMRPEQKIVTYVDPFGRRVGNGAIIRTSEGFEAVALQQGDKVARTYFALTERLQGGYLTLAASADALHNLLTTMLIVLTVSLVPTVVIVLLGGLWLARRSARRISAMEGVLRQITEGDLAARIREEDGAQDDLARIGRRIDQMAAAMQGQVTALKQVSSDIAHDLRTPIQRLRLMLEDATEAEGARRDELIEKAFAETEAIGRTFQSLLQLAQIEGGKQGPSFGAVDLADLVESVAGLYEPVAEDAGQRLVVEIEEAAPVTGDKTLLGQLLVNLIENAMRHAGPSAEIHVRLQGTEIVVSDNGPGIPEAERTNVLRRLYRLDSSRSTPGAGLGLSLVAAIAELHGAELSLEDNHPGLRVRLSLPKA